MGRCPKCKYTIRDCERTGESGADFFHDGCPSCGYGTPVQSCEFTINDNDDEHCPWCGQHIDHGDPVYIDGVELFHESCWMEQRRVEADRRYDESRYGD